MFAVVVAYVTHIVQLQALLLTQLQQPLRFQPPTEVRALETICNAYVTMMWGSLRWATALRWA